MSEQAKHTPGPWWVGLDEDGGLVYGVERDPDTGAESAAVVADTSREDGDEAIEGANAEVICRAVNAHADLLAACRLMASALLGFTADDLRRRVGEIHGPMFDAAQESLWAAINKAAGEAP